MTDPDKRPELDYQPADAFRRERTDAAMRNVRQGLGEGYNGITQGRFKPHLQQLTAHLLWSLGLVALGILAWGCVLLLGLITD